MLTAQELNETVWAYLKPSPIHGIGVFALRDIPKGQQLTNVGIEEMRLLSYLEEEELQKVHPAIQKLLLSYFLSHQEGIIQCMNPNAIVKLRCFMNHSNTPNTDGDRALRDIKAGEELTEDYTMFGALSSMSKKHYDSFL